MTSPPGSEWLAVPDGHPFGIHALPYGSFSDAAEPGRRRVGVAIGDQVLDLTTATERLLPERAADVSSGSLDGHLAAGPAAWEQLRAMVTRWLSDSAYRGQISQLLVPVTDVQLHLPFTVADYVDFYCSENHATNIGKMFRPDAEPLTPNWRHLPIGYHGRSGTVVVSGTPVRRPSGQSRAPGAAAPSFGPCARLDFEAELGFVVGVPSRLGDPVGTGQFAEHVFGVCLVNDWSARDIQAWEYVPLGPFLGKSFATSVSPWILPLAALEQARIRPPSRDTPLSGYLTEQQDWGLDIEAEVRLNGHVIARPPYSAMHWSPAQMLAHMTVNGASLRTGDLFASGTISGPERHQRGSLIELAWSGSEPLSLPDGSSRSWLEDGDEVVIAATAAGAAGRRIGLGDVRGQIRPAAPAE